MDDSQLLRYGRQILLPEIDVDGQQRLMDSRIALIGLGGLGSPIALYLAAAGVGHLLLIDHDEVELSNLQRQILFTEQHIGQRKTTSAANTLRQINPHCTTRSLDQRASAHNLMEIAQQVDLVVDASDNFSTRFAINQACVATAMPLVSGAAIRWEGQVAVFSGHTGHACYRCLYSEQGEDETSCATTGVAAPIVGVIGCMQAVEVIKLITGAGTPLYNRLLIYDGLRASWRSLTLKPDPQCPVCGKDRR
jgi:adenylyltransferase/sulfurtransferase